ncbi:MAG: alpha/beta fold hydrolase [Bryobacteraceae bacterium]|nr:alpha/beta fold hydrolase [Bryobacteraceae bacterium]
MNDFEPFFRNPHLSTLAGNFWKRAIDEQRFPTREVRYQTEPGTTVIVHENCPAGEAKGEVLMVHGLEGSSGSGYMVSLAQALCENGFAAHRLNMRGCGGTEHLTPTLYHSGLTIDALSVLRQIRQKTPAPLFQAGFSLGGNLTLKLAGELGAAADGLVTGFIAVSTPIDLAECVRRIDARENFLYQQRFVRSLRRRYLRRHMGAPERFPLNGLDRVSTIYGFDDQFTAPHFGFGTAANYYKTQSALNFVAGIRVPTLAIQAKDDPMIPFGLYSDPRLASNPAIGLRAVGHGGHLGFISRRQPRFWLDRVIIQWITEQVGIGRRLVN